MSWLTIMHIAGGSDVEAANPVATVGPYPTPQEAKDAGEIVYQSVRHVGYLEDECFFTIVEIPDQPQGPHVAIKSIRDEWEEDEASLIGVDVPALAFNDFLAQLSEDE